MANKKFSLVSPAFAISVGSLALMMACDRREAPAEVQAPPAASPVVTTVTQPQGEVPRATLRAGGAFVTAGSQGNIATAQELPEVQYHWMIVGGSISDGADSHQITYSVDEGGSSLTLYCHLRNVQGRESTAGLIQTIVPPPVVQAFEAKPPILSAGSEGSLAWSAKEIKSLTLDPGGLDVTKVGLVQVRPQETTTYTLTATNLADTATTRQLTLKVVPPPEIRSFGVEGRILIGQTATLKAVFANGRAEIRQGDSLLASSEQSPMTVGILPSDQASFQLTVTNEAGTSLTEIRTFQRPVR